VTKPDRLSLPRTLLIAALIVAGFYGAVTLWRSLARPETRLEPVACWFVKPASRGIECYRFHAPESRGTASNRQVEFPVVIFRSPSTPVNEPPVLHLSGGPGQPAGIENDGQIAGWVHFLDGAEWARDRDHVVVDTRGVGGRSAPSLRCPGLSDVSWSLHVDALRRDRPAQEAEIRRKVEACQARFTGEGVDLSAYDTATVAADLIDLRHALKLPSWTLYAISYGTRPALELMRRDPKGVHAAVLDSLNPPDVPFYENLVPNLRHALAQLYADCAAQPDCAAAYPDLHRDMETAVSRLRAAPVVLTLRQPMGKRTMKVTLDDALYLSIIESAFMAGHWVPFLPGVINDAAHGGTKLLAHLATGLVFDGYWDIDANALLMSTLCREEVPFNDPAAIRKTREANPLLAAVGDEAVLMVGCKFWPAGKAPDAFRQPVVSDVPTLMINGAYDTRTPPAFAEHQAAHLTYGYRIIMRSRGHSPSVISPCAKAAIDAFLDAPLNPTQPPCLQAQHPPHFMTRGRPEERVQRL
jgi:pimeloyl-ACP methyl ester carboxylesterase